MKKVSVRVAVAETERVWKPRNFEEAKSLGYGHRWGVGKELLRAIPGLC